MKGETNYTVEMTKEMVSAYKARPGIETVRELAGRFDKTERSVIAKLSREGVYQKQPRVGKTGVEPIRKESLVAQISEFVGHPVDSLEKASKQDLIAILSAFAKVQTVAQTVDE